jgi:acyl carrier protein
LQLEIAIAPMEPAQPARVAQLTQRTNQMNASCIRRSEAEIQALLASGEAECLTVDVKDRFGSYGLTGVVIFRCAGGALVADTFLLSCRVLGRGVEHRMVARLREIAKERGLARVEIPFVAGQRNRPAALFLESLGAAPVPDLPKPRVGRPKACPTSIDYVKIATELRDPVQILERIRMASRRPATALSAPPRTPLERELAELWAGLLNVPALGIHDNFFELGGHSLLAVQLLSRVRHIYGVELSLEVVYSGAFTVAELAKAVELKEIEQAGGNYRELLQELEELSDEEVRALLAEERDS